MTNQNKNYFFARRGRHEFPPFHVPSHDDNGAGVMIPKPNETPSRKLNRELTSMTDKEAIFIAALALAGDMNKPVVYRRKEECDVIYVVEEKNIDHSDEPFPLHVLLHLQDYVEIDASFNVNSKYGHLCNMMIIAEQLNLMGFTHKDHTKTGCTWQKLNLEK